VCYNTINKEGVIMTHSLSITDKSGNETQLFTEVSAEYLNATVFKKDGSIYRSIPKKYDSLQRYVLRIAQFVSGVNISMPVCADWDLKDYCDANNVEFRYVGPNASLIRKHIDRIITDKMIEPRQCIACSI
jgi:hypothetical protein